ncbi:MAG: hypothetical protein AB7J32_15880 [Pseudonocardia sp.]
MRAYGRSEEHVERVAHRSRAAADVSLRAVRMRTRFFGMLNGAELVGTSAVLVVGFLLVRADTDTVGAATAAALYFIRLFDHPGPRGPRRDRPHAAGRSRSWTWQRPRQGARAPGCWRRRRTARRPD